jgi:hypothetical protein
MRMIHLLDTNKAASSINREAGSVTNLSIRARCFWSLASHKVLSRVPTLDLEDFDYSVENENDDTTS